MKAAAAFCLAAAGVWMGLLLRSRRIQRVQILQDLSTLLREIENRTALLHLPLPKTIEMISQTDAARSLPFLKVCAEQCRNGVSFPHAWNTSVTAFLQAKRLRGVSMDLLPQLGASLACVSDAQLEKAIELYLQYLQEDLRQERQTLRTAGRLDVCLCAGGGILLGIMVL